MGGCESVDIIKYFCASLCGRVGEGNRERFMLCTTQLLSNFKAALQQKEEEEVLMVDKVHIYFSIK